MVGVGGSVHVRAGAAAPCPLGFCLQPRCCGTAGLPTQLLLHVRGMRKQSGLHGMVVSQMVLRLDHIAGACDNTSGDWRPLARFPGQAAVVWLFAGSGWVGHAGGKLQVEPNICCGCVGSRPARTALHKTCGHPAHIFL